MSNSEFKARALYDFAAEGPNELSFHANDILTITSNTAGHGWWYAKNSSGQVGVIPENYVQSLGDPPEPNEPPPSLATFSHSTNNYPALDAFNTSKPSYPPPYDDHQYMNPAANTNHWQAPESSAWAPSPPATGLTEEQTFKTFVEPSVPSSSTDVNPLTAATNPFDDYITVRDISPNSTFDPFARAHAFSEKSSFSEQSNGWYDALPKTPAPAQPRFDFGTTSAPPSDPPAPVLLRQQSSIYANVDTVLLTSSLSHQTSSSTSTVGWTPRPLKGVESVPADFAAPTGGKKKSRIARFLTFSRKRKPTKNRHLRFDEPLRNSGGRGSDSDSFSDSEYPTSSSNATNMHTQAKQSSAYPPNTLTMNSTMGQHGRPSMAAGEVAKGPPRARFFDKHGLDNYLLNGAKVKSDEHVEITFDDREGGVCWSANPGHPPFSCAVEEPSKGTKLGGLKAFMEYKIVPQTPGSRAVGRRYKQFDWLHEQLVNKYRFICIPPLPGKQIAGRFENEFVEERRRLLELWLNRICRHPVLCASFAVQHFVTCDASDKNKKDWKAGKRRIEKDEVRDAPWLSGVTVKDHRGSDSLESQINTFAQQQPSLEAQVKNLSQGLAKYIERHSEVYERDIQKISELFSRVHGAVRMDTATPGNGDLSHSIDKISSSYGSIAGIYKGEITGGLRDFNERIQEYIGMLACFPSILSTQRSASEFMKTVQNRAVTDLVNVADRYQTLNHVVLAEINFFQREKVQDLNAYLKALMDEQIQFYERIAGSLRDASATFK